MDHTYTKVPRVLIAKRPRYGLSKVLDDIEGLFIHSYWLRNRFYQVWLGLDQKDREGFRNEVRLIIRNELLGKEWWEALSKDIITKEGIKTNSNVYRYLKTRVFNGDARKMFSMLQDWSIDSNGAT